MSGALHLTITTPMEVIVDAPSVLSLRADDESGGFGILPGHTDFLTTLPASVVRWHGADGIVHFCALRAGLLTVTAGTKVAIGCREGILGDDLTRLEEDVAQLRADQIDANRCAQVEQMRLHANAVRQLIHLLRPGQTGALAHPPAFSTSGNGGAS